jgi:hypothetical protein
LTDRCQRCGFAPEHPCQLDIDHRDGNHKNDDPTNLQTLCANCHRLKTLVDRQLRSALTTAMTLPSLAESMRALSIAIVFDLLFAGAPGGERN